MTAFTCMLLTVKHIKTAVRNRRAVAMQARLRSTSILAVNTIQSTTASASKKKSSSDRLRKLLTKFLSKKHDSVVHSNDQEDGSFEDQYDDDGHPFDDEHDRRRFRAIRAIKRKTLEDFVLTLLPSSDELHIRQCRITKRDEGAFHHVVFVEIEEEGGTVQEFVLKIPAHGTRESWQEGDESMLRNEAMIMQHIRHHTTCPVPEVLAFDETLENDIGAPYILMKKLPGMAAGTMWHGEDINEVPKSSRHLDADIPTEELEQKRIAFLESLANAMAQLQDLQFTKIGTPIFDNPEDEQPKSIGPVWRWHSKQHMHELKSSPSCPTGRSFFKVGLDKAWCPIRHFPDSVGSSEMYALEGVRRVLEIAINSQPFKTPHLEGKFSFLTEEDVYSRSEPPKRFVLRHDDLDLQNIMVDDDGNVTGIIDWDGCMTVPRCVGFSSIPLFLRRDWLPDNWMHRAPFLTFSLPHYREVYARAMKKACNGEDAKFTRKSPLYQMLLGALYDGEDCELVAEMILKEIDVFRRVKPRAVLIRLGKGWPAAEKILEEKIRELMSPET